MAKNADGDGAHVVSLTIPAEPRWLALCRLVLSGRAKAAFDAIPPAVLVAVIAPSALATGWPETASRSWRASCPSPTPTTP